MKTCTFIGHRDCPSSVKAILKETIIKLIEEEDVTNFYVGNQGSFDSMVLSVLREIKPEYNIRYNVVLAYMPVEKKEDDMIDYSETIVFPEDVPKRFAISARNKWMIKQSDFLVAYVVKDFSNAYKFLEYAKKKKVVINIGKYSY